MASIFSKNGILSGRIDHYCLICAEQFTNEEETLAHILDLQHKENLKACGYFEKYKEDFIRKAKGVYFCEPCSLTFPTATKVELHIGEPNHIEEKNKISPWLKRAERDIIAFNQFLITDDAWNGCVEDTCVLCNTEFDDSASHKSTRSHILNLIKSEVIYGQDETIVYRTIDAKSKQCLTCNIIIGNDPTTHFKTAEHKDAYKMYDHSSETNEKQNITQNDRNTAKETHHVKVSNEKNNEKDINGDNGKYASKSVNKDVKKDLKKDTKKDLKEDANNQKGKDNSKQSIDSAKKKNAEELDKIYCKNLGAKNYITGGLGEKWCLLCEWILEDSPENHIRNKHHQMLLKLHKEKISNNNVPSKDDKSNLYESVDKYQKSNVNIDLINETAFCKKCSQNIDFNTDAIDKHIDEHKKNSNKKSQVNAVPFSSGIKSNGSDKTTLYTKPVLLKAGREKCSNTTVADYAKQHGLTHNRADNSYYCRLCSRRLPTTLDDLEKHVVSRIHTENKKQSSKTDAIETPVKVPIAEVIKSIELVDTVDEGSITVINDKYWLNAHGFFLIAKKDQTIFCHGCNIDLIPENVMQHLITSDNHRGIMGKCLLITSLENEFIREITLEVYHCGYCNIVENDWEDILDHLATAEHKSEKSKAEQSLRNHESNFYNRLNSRKIDVEEMIRQFVQFVYHHAI